MIVIPLLLTSRVRLYEVPHTKNVMAITKKRLLPSRLTVISARSMCIRGLRWNDSDVCRLTGCSVHSKKNSPDAKAGAKGAIGQSGFKPWHKSRSVVNRSWLKRPVKRGWNSTDVRKPVLGLLSQPL